MNAQTGYQAAVDRARVLPSTAVVPGVNAPLLSPTFGDTPVGLGSPYASQTMAELAAAGGGGLSPSAVAYVPFHNRYVPAAHALGLRGSDAGYSSLVGQFLRAAVATPASPSPGSLGDHYKEMLAAGQLQSYWQAMTQAMTQAPGDAEDSMRRGLFPSYGTQCLSLMPGAVAPDGLLLMPGSTPDVCRRAHELHTEALLYHCAGSGTSGSGASVTPGSHSFLTGPPTSVSLGLAPADSARIAAKVSPPARTKSRSRTPKTFAKRSHDVRATSEPARDDGSTAARTVAHSDTSRRVHANGKSGRGRDTVDGDSRKRKAEAEVSPDSSARKRRMRNDSTAAPSVRSASPRLNSSDARQEKRPEKDEARKESETSGETSVSRPDRKARSGTVSHNTTATAVTGSRAGYKSPPVTGESAADVKRMSLASSGAAVSSSCLLTGYHCTVTQLGLSPSSRTVHAPTFTPEVGTVFDGPVSAASSPARPLKTSPGSSPETVRSCTTAVDEVQPKEVRRSVPVYVTSATPERSNAVELVPAKSGSSRPATSADQEASGEASNSRPDRAPRPASTTASTTNSAGVASCRKVKVERGGSGVASPGGKGNATLTTSTSESFTDKQNTSTPPWSSPVDPVAGGNAGVAFSSDRNHYGLADMHVSCSVYPRLGGDDVYHQPPLMLPVSQSMDSGFYSEEGRRRLAISAGGWMHDYMPPMPIPSASFSPSRIASVSPGRTVASASDAVISPVTEADTGVVDLSAGSSRSRDKSKDLGCCSSRRNTGSSRDKRRTIERSVASSRTKHKTVPVSSNSSKGGGSKSVDINANHSPVATGAVGGNCNDVIVDLSAVRIDRSDVNAKSCVDVSTRKSELKTEPTRSRKSPASCRLDVKEESPDNDRRGSHKDTPPCSGSIPVGIAIARQRDAKHAQKDADEGTDEDMQPTCLSSSGFAQSSRQGRPMHHIASEESGLASGPETGELHKLPKSLSDLPTHIASNLVVTQAADVNAAMWPPPTIPGSVQTHVARPWMATNAPVNPAMWLEQGAFNVPHPPDPTHLPLAPHAELKLVQHPITGQLYLIPRVNWPSYQHGLSAPQFALEQQQVKDESAMTGQCCPPSESTSRPADCPAIMHMHTDMKTGNELYGSSQLSRPGDVQPHAFLPGVDLEPGSYHLPCPPPPSAHLRYYYDPSCFVRVAPPGEPTTVPSPSKMETQLEINVIETSSTSSAGGATTKKEICVQSSEAESGSETADTDAAWEFAHRTKMTTKSEKVSAVDEASMRETVHVLETVPKTEFVPPETISASDTVVSTKAENVTEVVQSEQSRCSQRHTVVESRPCHGVDKTVTTSKKEQPETSGALGGLHALYVASLQLHGETRKTTTASEAPLDGLQLLCNAMERAQTTPGDSGRPLDTTSESPAPGAAAASPDIEKNYNAPKKGSFTPLKTSLLRKDETGEWCCSPLKIGLENMDVLELEMRVRLAELQKKYKEKQRELARLQPRRSSEKDEEKLTKRRPGRPRKKSVKAATKVEAVTSPTPTVAPSSKVTPVRNDASLSAKKKRRKKDEPKSGDINLPAPKPKTITDVKPKVKANTSNKKSCPREDAVRLNKKLDLAKTTTKKRLFTGVADKPSIIVPKSPCSAAKSTKPASDKVHASPTPETAHSTNHGCPEKISSHSSKVSTTKKTLKEKLPQTKTETSNQEDLSWLLGDGWQRSVADSPVKKVVTNPKVAASPDSSSFDDVKWPTNGTPEKCEITHKDGFHDNGDISLQYASKKVEIMQTSVAAATSAALKSKKRKRLEDGSGLVSFVDEAPVKKRKPGRPKKFILTGKAGTETIVAKKPRHMTFFPSPPRSPGPEHRKHEQQPSPKNEDLPCYLSGDWNRRRSERIFLNDVESPKTFKPPTAVSSATRPRVTSPKPISSPQRELTSPKVTIASTVRPKVAAPKLTTSTTYSEVITTTSSTMTTARSSTTATDQRSRMKCVHDLSQKLKKKYSKSARKPDVRKVPTVPANKHTQMKPKPLQPPPNQPLSPPQKQPSQIFTYQKYYYSSDSESDTNTDEGDDVPLSSYVEKPPVPAWSSPATPSCIIHEDDLKDGLRVLLFLETLFFEGQVKGIHPPDVYGVVIDGERGNRPHVFSREEVLKLAVLDVKPPSPETLPDGARICAYWSQQFRCLYPGTVATDSPNPDVEPHLITVEFDDGDSGRIPISHVRLLPPDFPVQGVEPEVVGKRRRRTVSEDLLAETKERRPSISDTVCSYQLSDNAGLRQRRSTKRSDSSATSQPGGVAKERPPKKKSNSQERTVRRTKHKKDTRQNVFASNSQRSKDSRNRPTLKAKAKDSGAAIGRKGRELLPSSKSRLKTTDAKSELSDESDSDESLLSTVSEDEDSSSDLSDSDTRKAQKNRKKKKKRNGRVRGCIPGGRQLWQWLGTSTRRPGMKGRARKEFYKAIRRGHETIRVGDAAVFLSTGHNRLPYIGRIVSMWEAWGGNKVVKVKWFYHPEETKGGKRLAELMGALYLSPHTDENDVQTISHKIEVVSYMQYCRDRHRGQSKSGHAAAAVKRSNLYYLAGTYHPTMGMIQFEPDVKLI